MQYYQSNITPYDILTDNTYNVRLGYFFSDYIKPEILEKATQEAIKRYPYLAVKVVRKGESLIYVPNDLPIKVFEYTGGFSLGNKDVNYHLLAITYFENSISIHFNHSIGGGCRVSKFIKTLLYKYFTLADNRDYDVDGVILPDSEIKKEESEFPTLEKLPKLNYVLPSKKIKPSLQLENGKQTYFNIILLRQSDLMKYSKSHDGSPSSIVSVFMFKALSKIYKDNTLPINVGIAHNYINGIGYPNTTADVVRTIFTTYPAKSARLPIEFLSTITRASIYLQSDPYYCIQDIKKTINRFEEIEKQSTLEKKIQYAQENPRERAEFVNSNRLTFGVSYSGRESFGEISKKIISINIVVPSPLLVEISNTNDRFQLSIIQNTKNHKYVEAFCEVLKENNISYFTDGPFESYMAGIDIEI